MRVRIVRHNGGLSFYADRPALKELADELERLANAPLGEHFEFQTLEWTGNPEIDFEVFECGDFIDHSVLERIDSDKFDLSFMTLEDVDFEKYKCI